MPHDVSEIGNIKELLFDHKTEVSAGTDECVHDRCFQQAHVVGNNHSRAGIIEIIQPAQMHFSSAAFCDQKIFPGIVCLHVLRKISCSGSFSGFIKHVKVADIKGKSGFKTEQIKQICFYLFRGIVRIPRIWIEDGFFIHLRPRRVL